MFDGLLALFSSRGSASEQRRQYGSVVYLNKESRDGRRGYVVRASPREEGVFYHSINEAAVDVAERYKNGRAGIVSTLIIPFGMDRINASDVDKLLLECRLEAGARPSISPELRKQLGLPSEPRISVRKLQPVKGYK